jgi:hypothetical protein
MPMSGNDADADKESKEAEDEWDNNDNNHDARHDGEGSPSLRSTTNLISVARIIELAPIGARLASPASVYIPFDASVVSDTTNVQAYRYDQSGGVWVGEPCTVIPGACRLDTVLELSHYTLGEVVPVAPSAPVPPSTPVPDPEPAAPFWGILGIMGLTFGLLVLLGLGSFFLWRALLPVRALRKHRKAVEEQSARRKTSPEHTRASAALYMGQVSSLPPNAIGSQIGFVTDVALPLSDPERANGDGSNGDSDANSNIDDGNEKLSRRPARVPVESVPVYYGDVPQIIVPEQVVDIDVDGADVEELPQLPPDVGVGAERL